MARPFTEPRDPTPLYFRLKTVLQQAIESLAYAPGSKLPPEREIATIHGVSRITVRQALDALAREGLIRRGRGVRGGTFVRDDAGQRASVQLSGSFGALFSSEQLASIEVLAFDRRRTNADIAAALHLEPGTEVRYVERLLVARAGPVAHVRNFLPLHVGRNIRRKELGRVLLQDALVGRHGVKILAGHNEIEAILADAQMASLLQVGVGRPLLLVRRTLIAPGHEPINLSILSIVSDRYKLTLPHPESES